VKAILRELKAARVEGHWEVMTGMICGRTITLVQFESSTYAA